MKKILNGPTIYRTKCQMCDTEFEYNYSDTEEQGLEMDGKGYDYVRIVTCPTCKAIILHKDSIKTSTEFNRVETMNT